MDAGQARGSATSGPGRPDVNGQGSQTALASSEDDDALIRRSQIARSHGLRQEFAEARRLLAEIEPAIAAAGPEARVRYHLELGRTYASATHPDHLLTPEALALARQAYQRALDLARAAGLDALAIDAIHMFAFVDRAPADQLAWAEAALAVVLVSTQPEAQRWEASIRHNRGFALHGLGRYDEALEEFQRALALRERSDNAAATRVGRWMVAWTLRSLGRIDEALDIQLGLEQETAAAGQPDPYVVEELEALYRIKGDEAAAARYAARRAEARGGEG